MNICMLFIIYAGGVSNLSNSTILAVNFYHSSTGKNFKLAFFLFEKNIFEIIVKYLIITDFTRCLKNNELIHMQRTWKNSLRQIA